MLSQIIKNRTFAVLIKTLSKPHYGLPATERNEIFAFHGVNEQERIVGNTYLVSLKLGLDMSRACQSDQLEDTLNYASVYKQVAAVMKIPCNLIEHLAEKICLQLRNTFPEIQYIEIRLKNAIHLLWA